MTDDEIRVVMLKALLDIRELALNCFPEIEKLIDDGEFKRAGDKFAVFKAKYELEILRAENKILRDGKE